VVGLPKEGCDERVGGGSFCDCAGESITAVVVDGRLLRGAGVAKATAYKWSSAGSGSGKFPRFRRLPNGSIRIRRDWFEKWVDGLGPSA